MVAHRAGALKVAVVAVAMLVAIGSWEIYQGAEALAQGREVLFKCYTLAQTEGAVGERVDLTTEQFPPPENVQVGDPQLLCVPVTKQRGADTTQSSADADILCYKISPSTSVNETVTLTDQFRTDGQTARVTSAELLCVEVTKN
jgi:hypothetical protein